jgi:hypothetical protein
MKRPSYIRSFKKRINWIMPVICLLSIPLCVSIFNAVGVASILLYPIIVLGTSITLPIVFKKIGFFYNVIFVCGLHYSIYFLHSDIGYIPSEFFMFVTLPLLSSLFSLMSSYTQTVWTIKRDKDMSNNQQITNLIETDKVANKSQ